MKKFLWLVLSIVLVVAVVGCSTEPIEYTESLGENRRCYIDVVEVVPYAVDEDNLYYYCQCTLENGETVWMEILDFVYMEYFDAQYVNDFEHFGRAVKYDTAVRLQGKARQTGFLSKMTGQKWTAVFGFQEAEISQTAETGKRYRTAEAYVSADCVGKFVYAEFDSISFFRGYTEVAAPSNIVQSVFVARLGTGKKIYISIDMSDYKKYFDSSAKLTSSLLDGEKPKDLAFVQPVRIYGVCEWSPNTQNYLIKFVDADEAAISSAKVTNQPAVEYSDSVKIGQKVYVDIKNIEPLYEISSVLEYLGPKDYVCRCECADGSEIWVVMSSNVYHANFAKIDSKDGVVELGKATLYGRVAKATDFASNLGSKIGGDTVIQYESVDVID